MQQAPLISVIIPNYNHSSYLVQRIDSVLKQTFTNFEVILLDDCSTDNSPSILQSYSNHPAVAALILNKENTGNTFKQWERGISMAKGEYIWVAESDDYCDETFLERVSETIKAHPDAVVIRTGSHMTDENGNSTGEDLDYFIDDNSEQCFAGTKYIKGAMLFRNSIYNASMVVFKREAFNKIDRKYQNLRSTGDWLLWIEMLLQGDICEIRSKLNYFRQHTNKVSYRAGKNCTGEADPFFVRDVLLSKVNLSPYVRVLLKGKNVQTLRRISRIDASLAKAMQNATEIKLSQRHYIVFRMNEILRHIIPVLPSYDNNIKTLV